MANVRLHGETREQPIQAMAHTSGRLCSPLPLHPFDIATVSQVRASRQFRITLETNRYSVPAHYAGQALTLKTYPDRLCLYHGDTAHCPPRPDATIASKMWKTPITPSRSWSTGKKPAITSSSGGFSPCRRGRRPTTSSWKQRRLNPHHHVRKIVALSDIYAPEAVARAMEDAFVYEAFSAEYIANLLEQRARFTPEASALHLTRREDLLEISLEPPDLSLYQATPQPDPHDT